MNAPRDAAIGAQTPYSGRSIRRSEDERFLTGRACYVGDFKLDGMLHAVVVRSAHAHALLRGIDASRALALPGVIAFFAHADFAPYCRPIPLRLAPLEGFERYLQEPIARDRVRYVGEPIGVIVARNRYLAEDAAELVEADYAPLEPVVDVHGSLADRTVIHPATGSNVANHYVVEKGDVPAAFARADYTRRETFRSQRHSAIMMETRGLVAAYDAPAGKLTVWGATKVPFFNRRALAKMLQMAEASIEMIELDVGGGFGVRGEFYSEDLLIPAAALKLGRPVKWIEDRREHLVSCNHSREMECTLEVAFARDGRLLAMRGEILGDLGAYVRTAGGVGNAKAAQFMPGPYRLANYACSVYSLITNKTPVGTYRGPGRFEANLFRERLFDLAAADLGIDPVTIRLRNLIGPDEMPYRIGKLCPYEGENEYDTGNYPSALRRALEAIEYPAIAARSGTKIDGRYHGVGLCCFVESSGAGPSESARIVVNDARNVVVYTGCTSMGQGHETVLAQIAADALAVPFEAIRVLHGSTSYVEKGFGTYHSRAIVVGGSAVQLAAEKLIAQLVALAAERARIGAAQLEYRNGAVRVRSTGATVLDLEAAAALTRQGDLSASAALTANATFAVAHRTFTYGTHVAHVAVDAETAKVEVIRYVGVEDVGRAINPLLVDGQAIGGTVQGLGGALLEEFVYDAAGQLLTGTLADYLLPSSCDFPSVEAITLEEAPSKLNPLGVKGAGEGATGAVGAAIANAVAAALAPLRVTITEVPLSPNNLARQLRAARLKHSADSTD